MATEYPPLGKSYVVSYANNDRNFAIIGIRKDPRVDNYKIPEDLSPHPDSVRYPNHVFTGANPTNSDERVLWIYEILPAPWVPFTRYDDDLGPVQGRRRAVKNEGQKASLTASTKRTYEGRDGSAIVLNEIEETWSIKTDSDGNSLFPVRIRDFYDASRGPVQETRQLFVPTGEEVGSLENINGVITEISYEPYNEYLSFKVVRTYSVSGPQLIGMATDGDGQLVTVTTQRKASDDYTPPEPTAIKTVEVSREDAESLIERVIDTPQLFDGKTLSASKPDVIPERFRASIPNETIVEIKEGSSVATPELSDGEFEKTVQRQSVHTVRETTVARDPVFSTDELSGVEYEESYDIDIPFVERVASSIDGIASADISPLGDGKYLVREYNKDDIEANLDSFYENYPTRINLNLPKILKSISVKWDERESVGEQVQEVEYEGSFNSISYNDQGSCSADISAQPQFDLEFEEVNGTNIFAYTHLFFVKSPVTIDKIKDKCFSGTETVLNWPVFKTKSYNLTSKGASVESKLSGSVGLDIVLSQTALGTIKSTSSQYNTARSINNIVINIPSCVHGLIRLDPNAPAPTTNGKPPNKRTVEASPTVTLDLSPFPPPIQGYAKKDDFPPASSVDDGTYAFAIDTRTYWVAYSGSWTQTSKPEGPKLVLDDPKYTISETVSVDINLPATDPPDIPRSEIYLVDSSVEPYKYGFYLVRAVTVDASQFS
ncbi:MAG: hypothetical protein EBR82_42195 [Caulobacteraceae bacterium]|nr:hypothetical protein [Caulobacteraceae bacterium]